MNLFPQRAYFAVCVRIDLFSARSHRTAIELRERTNVCESEASRAQLKAALFQTKILLCIKQSGLAAE
jgi:hypothetical protein